MLRALFVGLLLCWANCWAGMPGKLRWADLHQVIGHKVIVALPDGTMVSGKAREVTPDALIVDVKHSGNEVLHPRGRTEVPRASFKGMEVSRDTVRWRAVGTGVGAAGGLILGAIAVVAGEGVLSQHQGRDTTIVLSSAGALGFAGYELGSVFDRRMRTVEIID